jgi:ceramide glucosyltransferase
VKRSWFVLAAPIAYQALAIVAALAYLVRRRSERKPSSFSPAVSVLKPLKGSDPNTYPAFLSQVRQNYPDFEILFGARDENDPAVEAVHRLQLESPDAPVRIVIGSAAAANGKVGVLIELARHARHSVWVVNDSDIKVGPDYLRRVVSPLADTDIGVVTCPYRAMAHTPAAAWEAVGIATDFIPSTLVAQMLGVRDFGMGSTLCFRVADLQRAGGFEPLADYLADDYQLARRVTRLGKRATLSTYVVETSLGEASWAGVWHHQLRWARTIRFSKGLGYFGLPISQAGVWIFAALAFRAWRPALALALLRIASAYLSGTLVLESDVAARWGWLSPVRDLYSFAVWAASFAGREVIWRGLRLGLTPDGRIAGREARELLTE